MIGCSGREVPGVENTHACGREIGHVACHDRHIVDQRRGGNQGVAVASRVGCVKVSASLGNINIYADDACPVRWHDRHVEPAPKVATLDFVTSFREGHTNLEFENCNDRKKELSHNDGIRPCCDVGVSLSASRLSQFGNDICVNNKVQVRSTAFGTKFILGGSNSTSTSSGIAMTSMTLSLCPVSR